MSYFEPLGDAENADYTDSPEMTVIGELVGVNENGEPLVSYGNLTSVTALSVLSVGDVATIETFPLQVLITFEHGKSQPIIAGLVSTKLFSMDVLARKNERVHENINWDTQAEEETIVAKASNDLGAEIDGKKIVLSGKEEILLKCGKSSILMQRDGKIVIKGSNITSRSSSANKIKGSSVSIN